MISLFISTHLALLRALIAPGFVLAISEQARGLKLGAVSSVHSAQRVTRGFRDPWGQVSSFTGHSPNVYLPRRKYNKDTETPRPACGLEAKSAPIGAGKHNFLVQRETGWAG